MPGRSQGAVQLNRASVACSLVFIILPVSRVSSRTPVLNKSSFEDRLLILITQHAVECLLSIVLINVVLNVGVSKYFGFISDYKNIRLYKNIDDYRNALLGGQL